MFLCQSTWRWTKKQKQKNTSTSWRRKIHKKGNASVTLAGCGKHGKRLQVYKLYWYPFLADVKWPGNSSAFCIIFVTPVAGQDTAGLVNAGEKTLPQRLQDLEGNRAEKMETTATKWPTKWPTVNCRLTNHVAILASKNPFKNWDCPTGAGCGRIHVQATGPSGPIHAQRTVEQRGSWATYPSANSKAPFK